MPTFREQKRRARNQLHERLAEPVLYLSDRASEPVTVTARLHLKFAMLGDLHATRVGFGEQAEMTPKIVFMNAQVRPIDSAIVITKDMGAFVLQTVEAPDDITTSVEVYPMLEDTVRRYGWDPDALWLGFPAP